MDYLKSLAVFIRVAELGNFSAVAQEFDVSGTMIGKHIQALERRLGGKLIARSTRRQSLTDLGALFLERARAILADIETADALADEIRQQPRGTLRPAHRQRWAWSGWWTSSPTIVSTIRKWMSS
ncbi:LysR family transcriptional regulator [Mangrovitalea sediminis]|uniref:LysR family transcriptional regulator n=1 Tax=Mangrovitalea sediminis TaxID=1982043 RepID=UPI000BE57AB4|nr:LysR family transcriptional regulator [Mangrovitalea sediminis]